MGEIRPDNGGATPPDDGGAARFDGLPDLPPEWGTIVVPDDASALAEEAEAVRRELMLAGPRRNPFGRWPAGRRSADAFAAPLVIVAVAVLITMVSLFAASWRPPEPTPTNPASVGPAPIGERGPDVTQPKTAPTAGLAGTRFVDPAGASLELGHLLPAVIIFMDGCDCSDLVLQVAAAVPNGVTVIAAGTTPPAVFGAPTNVRTLQIDRESALWTTYAARLSLSPAAAPAVIINRSGSLVAVIPAAESASDITPLDRL